MTKILYLQKIKRGKLKVCQDLIKELRDKKKYYTVEKMSELTEIIRKYFEIENVINTNN